MISENPMASLVTDLPKELSQIVTRPNEFNVKRRRCGIPAIAILLALISTGCGSSRSTPSAADDALQKVAIQLNWYAEAEHGGAFQAKVDGTYDRAGFEVEIRPGGRATPIAAEIEMGRAAFAIANADDVVLFRAAGADVVAVAAAMQDHPRCILVRADSGVESLEQLKGLTLQRQEGQGFVEFLRSRRLLDGVREVPYHGSVSNLVNDPKVAIQAYSFAEPFLARGEGAEVRLLMLSDLGWNPYSSVLVTRGSLIRDEPEMVRRFVQATVEGWRNYLVDPTAANRAILASNQHGMTAEALAFGSKELVRLARPGDMPIEDVGKMTADRWESLVRQMIEIRLIEPAKVTADSCYTTEFL